MHGCTIGELLMSAISRAQGDCDAGLTVVNIGWALVFALVIYCLCGCAGVFGLFFKLRGLWCKL